MMKSIEHQGKIAENHRWLRLAGMLGAVAVGVDLLAPLFYHTPRFK